METDVRHILPSVQAPTLVLHRTGDLMTRVDEGRYTAEHIPGARFVELPGDDHLYPLDDLVPHIAAFVESLRVEQADFDRVLATVLFTDIVDSTAQAPRWATAAGEISRAGTIRSCGRISGGSGEEIKTMGDGFLATFDGPARGVRCAEAIAASVRPLGIEIRAGCTPARSRPKAMTSPGSAWRSAPVSARKPVPPGARFTNGEGSGCRKRPRLRRRR